MNTQLYYVMDTMCGWCYGFSDVIQALHANFKHRFAFHIVPGGMWVGADVKKFDAQLAAFVAAHNQNIVRTTGKSFGSGYQALLASPNGMELDSLPGAKAITLMQQWAPEHAFAYLKKVQEALFVDGHPPTAAPFYAETAAQFGIDSADFAMHYASPALQRQTAEQFALAAQLGAYSYPSLIAVTGQQARHLMQGYASFEVLAQKLEQLP